MSSEVPNWRRAVAANKRRFAHRREAHAFLIWRTAEALCWNTSIEEIAGVTGLTEHRVSKIAKDRGWLIPSRVDDSDPPGAPVDVLISGRGTSGFRRIGGRTVPVECLRSRRET